MIQTTSNGPEMDQVYKFAYTSYILGFFTGINAMENKAAGMREIDTFINLHEIIVKNPSDNIYDAMISVLSQIRN